MLTAIMVFICTYFFIVLGVIHRTVVAFVGAMAMLLIGVLTPGEAFKAIDFDTIGLLVGMMIIVGITRNTGILEYLAIKAAQSVKGEPIRILAALCLITALLSAFLDNVTTVMLIIPVTFAIVRLLRISPFPFLTAIIISSNIGGTATLVGDPPNIMISGFTGLGFMDFLSNLGPVVLVIYIVTISMIKVIFKHQMATLSTAGAVANLQLHQPDLFLRKFPDTYINGSNNLLQSFNPFVGKNRIVLASVGRPIRLPLNASVPTVAPLVPVYSAAFIAPAT